MKDRRLAPGPVLLATLALAAACASAGPAAAPAPPTAPAASAPGAAAPAPAATRGILIFTRSTGFVHKSTPTAAQAIAAAVTAAGVPAEVSEDPKTFTREGLARYGAVVLVATAGKPLGPPEDPPGGAAIEALGAFVRGGGGLVGIHNATNAHIDAPAFVSLLGGIFAGHPGGVRTATCAKEGDHPSLAKLPAAFAVTDEIYLFKDLRPDNQVLLRCGDERVPVAWHRAEGAGRIFYSSLGHLPEAWTEPGLLQDFVLPGILWALGR